MCNSPLTGVRSREHVFPQWLQRHLQITQDVVRATHWKQEGDRFNPTPASVRELGLGSMTEGRICGKCNSGWMSQLEAESMPILKALMNGSRTLDSLTSSEKSLISRWAAKTAYMLNSSANFNLKVPTSHAQALRVGDCFRGVAVVAKHHLPTERHHWAQNSTWLVVGNNPSDPAFLENLKNTAYKIVLQFDQLILMTLYCPDTCQLMLWKGIHLPLFLSNEPIWDDFAPSEFVANNSQDEVVGFSMMATLRKN